MKQFYLSILAVMFAALCVAQTTPNNVNIGLYNNGTNGSNAGSGAFLEVPLRIKPGGTSYTAIPAAEDFILYLKLPKSDFQETDVITVVQVNTAIYGASGAMSVQPITDIGDPTYLYAGIVLNAPAGMNLSSLSSVTNAWSFAFTIKITNAALVNKTVTQHRMVRIVDQLNNTFLSGVVGSPTFTTLLMSTQNQLTNAAITVLPVNLMNFSGFKSGTKNVLRWTTANEENNKGFEVQRSLDGVNYTDIGFVNSIAPGGTSSMQLNYTFDDNSPAGKKQYYRLRQLDFDGGSKLSNIVLITGDRPITLSIGGLFPNPARTQVNVIVDAPQKDNITVLVTDVNGKKVKQQLANVDIGSNTIGLDISALASGSYFVKLLCQNAECETAISKFNKE